MQKTVILVDEQQYATILAALRLYQHEGLGDQDTSKSILDEKGIDDLVVELQAPSIDRCAAILSALKYQGMLFGECTNAFGSDDTDPYVKAAQENHHRDGEIEVGLPAVVSRGSDDGAYVMAWVWVRNEEAGVSEEDTYVQVEYDTTYTGGDYNGVGSFVYIPEKLIEAAHTELSKIGAPSDYEDALHLAFRKQTHLDSMHIVHYDSDERYTQDGELIEQ